MVSSGGQGGMQGEWILRSFGRAPGLDMRNGMAFPARNWERGCGNVAEHTRQ